MSDSPEQPIQEPIQEEKNPLLEELEAQLKLEKEKALRAQAEVQNIIKRSERDVSNAYKYALERFVTELLPVVDSLEQAMEAHKDEGVRLTLELFSKVLTQFGVRPINPEGAFDPTLHEAVSVQENQEAKPNTVLQVFQKGYTLNDRVVRPARVVVSKLNNDP